MLSADATRRLFKLRAFMIGQVMYSKHTRERKKETSKKERKEESKS